MHNGGWRTVYGHLGSATVKDGDDVRAGQQIGTVGLTAGDGRPSIHFETRQMRGDDPVAVDPLSVLPRWSFVTLQSAKRGPRFRASF